MYQELSLQTPCPPLLEGAKSLQKKSLQIKQVTLEGWLYK